jgi:cytochrome c oxidase subunit 2
MTNKIYDGRMSMTHILAMAAQWWLPQDAALHGPALDHQLLLNLWIVLALLVLAHIFLFAGLLLRGRSLKTIPLAWKVVPLLALTALFVWLTVQSEHLWAVARIAGADASAMQVEVTGVQFAWYFRYPGTDATFGNTRAALVDAGGGNPLGIDPADTHGADDIVSSELVLPVGREVDLRLRSLDVMHGFFVPEMRLKQNAVPGSTLHVHFTPTVPGTYAILCSQLCGLGHYRMQATLRVLPQDQFDAWMEAHEAR